MRSFMIVLGALIVMLRESISSDIFQKRHARPVQPRKDPGHHHRLQLLQYP